LALLLVSAEKTFLFNRVSFAGFYWWLLGFRLFQLLNPPSLLLNPPLYRVNLVKNDFTTVNEARALTESSLDDCLDNSWRLCTILEQS
jgi:hypothetical protein